TYRNIRNTKTYRDIPIKKSSPVIDQQVSPIAFKIDLLLLNKIKSLVNTSKLNGDFKYPSVVSFLKTSLLAYRDNKFHLSYQRNLNNQRTKFSFRIDDEMAQVYNSLPSGNRTEILERIMGTY